MTELFKLLKDLGGPLLVGIGVGAIIGLLFVFYVEPHTPGGTLLLFCIGIVVGLLATYFVIGLWKLLFRGKQKEPSGSSAAKLDGQSDLPST